MAKIIDWKEILPHGYLSASAINSYLMCPKAFKFSYHTEEKAAPSLALIEGSVVHAALEAYHRKRLEGDNPEFEWIAEQYDAALAARTSSIPDIESTVLLSEGEEDLLTVRQRDLNLLKQWRNKYADKFEIVSVEAEHRGTIAGIPIKGYTDLIVSVGNKETKRDAHRIIDFKVAKRTKSVADTQRDIQMGIYALLTGIHDVEYITLNKKQEKIQRVSTTRTEWDLNRVKNVVLGVGDAIRRQCFPYPAPTSWKCTKKFCGFWDVCEQGEGK